MRRVAAAALVTATLAAGALTAVPARAAQGRAPATGECTATACHFDVPPGTYDVTVLLGGEEAARTSLTGETRRSLLPETATAPGERVARSFTVDVRTPEGEPAGPAGSPGLDLTIGGPAPPSPPSGSPRRGTPGRSSSSGTPRSATSRRAVLRLGQQLPQYLRKGLSVANHADSGESTVSYLADERCGARCGGSSAR